MGTIGRFTKKAAVNLIEYYQKNISHSLNTAAHSSCFYKPSCSQYTKEAVLEHGAVKGSMQGLLRLMRCIPAMRQQDAVTFLRILSKTDEPAINQLVQPDSQATKNKITLLRDEMLKKPVDSIWDPISKTTKTILKELDIHTIDKVKNVEGDPLFFVHGLEEHKEDPNTEQKNNILESALPAVLNNSIFAKVKKTFGNAFHAAGQTAGGIAMGMIGGALGLTVGAVAGTATGGVASLDLVDKVNDCVAKTFTPQSADGMVLIEKTCGKPAYLTHHVMSDHKIPHWLASSVAFLPGIISGAALGIYHGVKFGVKEGWYVGRAIGDYGANNIVT